jgi:hypothetical protein
MEGIMMTRRFCCMIPSVLLFCFAAWAGSGNDGYTRLARLSHLEGHVSFQHAAETDWAAASINLPLQPGDRIYTGPEGRAEIEFDDGACFRLAENADIEILSLREDLIQLRILAGLATLTVSGRINYEVDTSAAAFTTLRKGVYRFDVAETGDSDAIVRKGELDAANDRMSRRIQTGELLHVTPGGNGTDEIAHYNQRDAWDEWNDRRTADIQAYASTRYLPDTVLMGTAELDRYGRWVDDEDYGSAWVPLYVDVSWSPFSVGRWCYRPLWGWTWISYEPWGWLPYHYGRWHHSPRHGWCWLPGPSFVFNFWSPGLVTFYSGPGWVSWCPLGPGDYYNINNYHYNHGIYSYQLSRLRGLNTRAPGDPMNRHARGAFRTVQVDQFTNGSFGEKGRSTRWGDVEQPWRQGTLVRERLAVQPTSSSFAAAPEREVVRPSGTRALPAVVRNTPSEASGSRFNRIANPPAIAQPARTWQNREDPGDRRVGVSPTETPERNNAGAHNSATDMQRNQIDRRLNSPGADNAPVGNALSSERRRYSPQVQPEATDGNPPAIPRQQYGSTMPEERIAPQPRSSDRPQGNSSGRSNPGGGNRAESGRVQPNNAPGASRSEGSAGRSSGSPRNVPEGNSGKGREGR